MRVLIVDDHPLFIKGVQALLSELEPGIETTGARSLEDASAAAGSTPVDLVLLDLKLPGTHDLDALVRMRALLESTPIVVISGNDSAEYIWRAIDLGAAGYIPKDTDQSLIIHALRVVLARGVYIPPQALRGDPVAPATSRAPHPARTAPPLSSRQMAVLQMLLQGKSNKVIARDLSIAEGTVKTHLWAIYQALGVNSRLQAMAKAHELRLVEEFGRLQ
jgi:DNA-binding NarL/FixJ family response regulator